MKKEMTFENAIARLEEIVAALESGDSPLDETMSLFEEGIRLSEVCNKKLTAAEQKIIKVTGQAGASGAEKNGESND
jgi:exodeoxyribonuclease VII small subunit